MGVANTPVFSSGGVEAHYIFHLANWLYLAISDLEGESRDPYYVIKISAVIFPCTFPEYHVIGSLDLRFELALPEALLQSRGKDNQDF